MKLRAGIKLWRGCSGVKQYFGLSAKGNARSLPIERVIARLHLDLDLVVDMPLDDSALCMFFWRFH